MYMVKNDDENERLLNFSVLIALGMVYEGLGGSTKASVASSLGFPEDEQRFRDGFKVKATRATIFHVCKTTTLSNI